MNYTTNFNLNKPEGTDLYNHLTVDNPNMDTIDATMQANKLASVGAATELVSGTVHAINRADSNQNIFKFKATGDFKAGDTITIDGVTVNAYTTAGQQLPDDAYVLSSEVICILDNTSLWVLSNKVPSAKEVSFDNTGTDIAAVDTNAAIVAVNNKADMVKTCKIESFDNLPQVSVFNLIFDRTQKQGQILCYNSNRGFLGLIRIDSGTVDYIPIIGSITPTLNATNTQLTVDWSLRPWGCTTFIQSYQ